MNCYYNFLQLFTSSIEKYCIESWKYIDVILDTIRKYSWLRPISYNYPTAKLGAKWILNKYLVVTKTLKKKY